LVAVNALRRRHLTVDRPTLSTLIASTGLQALAPATRRQFFRWGRFEDGRWEQVKGYKNDVNSMRHSEEKPISNFRSSRGHRHSQGLPKFVTALICRAHRAVIFAIAQLSFSNLASGRYDIINEIHHIIDPSQLFSGLYYIHGH